MGLKINKLSDALGAEITDIDLSGQVDDATLEDVRNALNENLVLVIRDQDFSPGEQVAFSQRFGELVVRVSGEFLHPDFPPVLILSNEVGEDGKTVGATSAYAGDIWHSDLTYAERPSMGSLLHALQVPEKGGGDTAWANMYTAYETLDDETKHKIDGLKATHVRDRRRNWRATPSKEFDRDLNEYYSIPVPDSVHPVVRTHPETGRKALFVSPRFTVSIEDMEEDEAQPLLDKLFAHQISPEFIFQHQWRKGDLVFWDNRATIHLACGGIVPPGIRHLHRTSIGGDIPF
ncbi:MAG: TauD/TfdA family dioxygenase [Rhodospirillales bacterium]|jgi:taurine dioxygenase|nr:TauD/TfdA family dioxygenase [Rhodospirillales bacterium]MBT4007295.1 TauD/TfdA family dioxygenase [Rhodospirillales bacterium]MBT5077000.1 TauD/TfdA family dioxygenase [Rhodospirillales bacterium]MBT5113628.1 TauD/TfdA family dioxygenase [Rhodospirillales bacterium]MBT5673926.1 TauD/TfdA family dioxygenase [Rhodospirillales bacterium]